MNMMQCNYREVLRNADARQWSPGTCPGLVHFFGQFSARRSEQGPCPRTQRLDTVFFYSTLYIFWTHIRERGKIQRNKFRRKGYFYPFRGIYLAV